MKNEWQLFLKKMKWFVSKAADHNECSCEDCLTDFSLDIEENIKLLGKIHPCRPLPASHRNSITLK